MTPPPLPQTTGSRLAKIGLWMQLGSLIGISETVKQLVVLISETWERAQNGAATVDMALISKIMQAATRGSLIGNVISIVGALLVLLAYTRYRYRQSWAFWFLIAFLILGMLNLPVFF